MTQIFIELYRYKDAWMKLPEADRRAYVGAITDAVNGLTDIGVEVVGYGMNAQQTSHRAPYDFFCVYKVPNAEIQREFEAQIEAAGWYDYFDQINVSGDITGHAGALIAQAELAAP